MAIWIIGAVTGAAAQASASPVISYRASDLETYLAAVSAAEADMSDLCQRLKARAPAEGRVWLRIGPNGLEIAPEDDTAAEAAAFWADLALGARDAARKLYGRSAGDALARGPVQIELSPNGASVFDGGARADGDLCAAMARVAGAMGPGATDDPFAAARAAAAPASAAPLPVGGSVEVTLGAPLPQGAILRGPDGVTAAAKDGAPEVVRISAALGASPGAASLRIYAPDDPFRPLSVTPLRILPGAPPPPVAKAARLSPGGRYQGAAPVGGETAISVRIDQPGVYRFSSESEIDVSATLETAAGEPVARSDDSTGSYDFSLSANLTPGAYVLKVTHCCGGGGAFSVSSTTE